MMGGKVYVSFFFAKNIDLKTMWEIRNISTWFLPVVD